MFLKKIKAFAAAALVAVGALGVVVPAMAGGGGEHPLDKFPTEKLTDVSALQNGAKLFVNYCLNCHGASAMRYNRLRDIGLTDDQIRDNLLFTAEKVGETMTVPMPRKEAKAWFGSVPPDLSVIARARSSHSGTGSDWLYTYLRTYYVDSNRATGWNNLVFPNVGMPHVLWELQGVRSAEFKKVESHGKEAMVFDKFVQVTPGKMKTAEFDEAVADLVAFVTYMAEPAQMQRKKLGVVVLIFLGFFFVIAWMLNKAFWKDIK